MRKKARAMVERRHERFGDAASIYANRLIPLVPGSDRSP
jgi:hypothetical protein